MCIKHVLVIDEYTQYQFDDSVDAFECYQLLSRCKRIETDYAKREDGTTDYDKQTTTLVVPNIRLQLRKC